MSRRKKVLMISRRYLPATGGVEKHIQNICNILSKTYSVTILTENDTFKSHSRDFINDIEVLRFNYPKIKYIGLVIIWLKLVKYLRIMYSADIIHIHDVFIWFLPFRLIFFWKSVFITFHGWEGKYPIPVTSRFQKKIAFYLTTGSIAVGEYISKFYSISPTKVIYGAVSMITSSKFYNKKDIILYLGRLESDTGILTFIKLLSKKNAELDKYSIVFCGDGCLRHLCEKYGTVTGFVDPTLYLSESKVCIASGYLSTLESTLMKCYTVVIADNDYRKMIFVDTPFELHVNIVNSYHELKKVFTHDFLNSKDLRKTVQDARKWAMSYTWENIVKEYITLWDIPK